MMILAPLRGVTIRSFREVFAVELAEAGFTEAFTPFISAMPGVDPLKDRELMVTSSTLPLTPQFIGKDPRELRRCLECVKAAGYMTADLNCGCPFPMVRNKGRGSGLLRNPDNLQRMLEVGCEVMGDGAFSIKARLGVERTDELLGLMSIVNQFPLRFLTVHARTAKQMYIGDCDYTALASIESASRVPVVRNGDLDWRRGEGMVGRSFIRYLGERNDSPALLERYIERSKAELYGENPVIGRMKELLGYWKESPRWSRLWPIIKLARNLNELKVW